VRVCMCVCACVYVCVRVCVCVCVCVRAVTFYRMTPGPALVLEDAKMLAQKRLFSSQHPPSERLYPTSENSELSCFTRNIIIVLRKKFYYTK